MKLRHTLVAAAGTAALVAGGVTLAAPGQAESTTSSAFGISAEGPIPIEPMPSISSTGGQMKTSNAGSVPANPVATATVAELYAGNAKAGVTLAEARVGEGLVAQLPPEFKAGCEQLAGEAPDGPGLPEFPEIPIPGVPTPQTPEDATALCDALLGAPSLLDAELIKVSCDGDRGNVQVANLRLLGQSIEVPSTAPNTSIPADPLLNVTINKQTRNSDGSLTVAGVVVSVGDGAEVVTLGSATCGARAQGRAPAAPADAPTPVTRNLPVTG